MTGPQDHGILLKPDLIQATLDGRKIQTCRVITMHNSLIDGVGEGIKAHWPHLEIDRAWVDKGPSPAGNPGEYLKVPCHRPGYCDEVVHRVYPRVQPDDRLWVREAWFCEGRDKPGNGMHYRANACAADEEWFKENGWTWRSPLHMPKWAARLWLPVTGVRAHRIQDITFAQAAAEGFIPDVNEAMYQACQDAEEDNWDLARRAGFSQQEIEDGESGGVLAVYWLRRKWDAINAHRPGCSWADNPLVWAYDFTVDSRTAC